MSDAALFDNVSIKNRCDEPVEVLFDGTTIVWAPGQTRAVPKQHADFFVHHSTVRWNPYTHEAVQKLVVLGSGMDESPLTHEQANPPELLDRDNMDPTHFDPETGEPLRPEYKEIRQRPGRADVMRDRAPLVHAESAYDKAFDQTAPEARTPE